MGPSISIGSWMWFNVLAISYKALQAICGTASPPLFLVTLPDAAEGASSMCPSPNIPPCWALELCLLSDCICTMGQNPSLVPLKIWIWSCYPFKRLQKHDCSSTYIHHNLWCWWCVCLFFFFGDWTLYFNLGHHMFCFCFIPCTSPTVTFVRWVVIWII